jgi:hypothetical protein
VDVIAQLPVIFDCNDDPDDPSFGDIYTPAHMELEAGVVEVTGWAIDTDDLEQVEIWVDGADGLYVGNADIFLDSPEVEDLYPWLPNYLTNDAGFSFEMDTEALNLADGEHVIVVWTEDEDGGRNILGQRTFVLDN